jgi:beta-glucanase (GH16 family)
VGTAWGQVFGDEFDGTAVDRSKWWPTRDGGSSCDKPFVTSEEGAAYCSENVSVADGQLTLTLRPGTTQAGDQTYSYSSGTVTTGNNFRVQRGDYAEARIFVPSCDGCWPAFWSIFMPYEIDGFEFFDTSKQAQPRFNYHPGGPPPTAYGEAGTDYRNSWHTYGVWRKADGTVVPYLDGVAYPAVAAQDGDDAQHFLIMNLAMYQGHDPGTQAMRVDWVRVHRPQ